MIGMERPPLDAAIPRRDNGAGRIFDRNGLMCARYAISLTAKELAELLAVLDIEDFPPRYNIAPTQPILVVTAGPARDPGSNLPRRMALLVRWGFIPSWVKDPRQISLLVNARSETAAGKASFRAAMRHRRVLVPASGFYEWKRLDKKRSQPYWVRPRHGGLVTFGGLMETYLEPGGAEIDTAAILTTSANGVLAPIHERMPVVVQPQDHDRWLDCVRNEPADVADIMAPVEDDYFEAVPVSDLVNKVGNMGPEIQEPIGDVAALPPTDASSSDGDQLRLL